MFLGLRTVIYPAPDLEAAKRFYTGLLGFEPYFDEPFYVGFAVAGYELALDPNGAVEDGPVTYWGVRDADEGLAWLTSHGATERSAVQEVGGGIREAAAADPFGSIIWAHREPAFRGRRRQRADGSRALSGSTAWAFRSWIRLRTAG